MLYNLKINDLMNAFGGPSAGTRYDLSKSCKYCGTGAEPIGPRFISELKKSKKKIFYTLDREVLMDMTLVQHLSKAGIDCFAKVFNTQKNQLPYMELRGEAILPSFSHKTDGYIKEGECPYCKRDGYFNNSPEKLSLVYENLPSHFLTKNILITYERFGLSALREPFKDSVFASPLFVVSDLIKNAFETEKIKTVTFEPVTLLVS